MDNNSSDNSVELLESQFPNTEFIALDENIGFGKANNLGFQSARGKYILILNPDTIIGEDTLQTMYDFMEATPEAGMAGCKVLNPDGSFQLACRRGFPTPWAAFTKLSGLQSLFPNSRLFARYNQTYRSIDETYETDALIGAFMFARREVIEDAAGFDPDFFMYGEDLDLCYRAQQYGWKIYYVHSTSIIHYKGESTRRSNINEVKHFYEAMSIFAGKHLSSSRWFMLLLRIGIILRSVLAYAHKYRTEAKVILGDVIIINSSLIIGTMIKFGGPFDFPDYAYPTVFIVVTLVLLLCMTAVGEYFESRHSVSKSFFGFMMGFFVLSSLTYFFKSFAFSRGVVLMTIGFSTALGAVWRSILNLNDKTYGLDKMRKVLLVGLNDASEHIAANIEKSESNGSEVAGIITTGHSQGLSNSSYPVLGNLSSLRSIINTMDISEVIITDKSKANSELMGIIHSISGASGVRFHIAGHYDELIASRIICEVSDDGIALPLHNISRFRYRLLKRLFDIVFSAIMIIAFPIALILMGKSAFSQLWSVLVGSRSLIGYHSSPDKLIPGAKSGVISMADVSRRNSLSPNAIRNLDDYYLKNYSFSLDMEILFKYISGNKRGR